MGTTYRRRLIAGTVALLTLCAVGGAVAYWTQAGSGSGTGSTGTTTAVTVNQTSTVSNLHPGGAPVTLSGDFTNPNSGPVKVGAVTTTGLTVDAPHAAAGCDASWYTLGGSAVVDAEIPAGTNVGSWSGLTVVLDNRSVNQDACKGATVTISYAVSAAA